MESEPTTTDDHQGEQEHLHTQQHRKLQDDECDDFYFNAEVSLLVPGSNSNPSCTAAEIDEIDATLVDAFTSVIDIDPRLRDVLDLSVEICSTTQETRKELRRRLRRGQHEGTMEQQGESHRDHDRHRELYTPWLTDWLNLGISGRCQWGRCSLYNSDGDHGGYRDLAVEKREEHSIGTTTEKKDEKKADVSEATRAKNGGNNASAEASASSLRRNNMNIKAEEEEGKRVLQSDLKVDRFKLYNTEDDYNSFFLKTLQHADVIDIQTYGTSSFTVEAEVTGTTEDTSVNFSLDSTTNYKLQNSAPYFLSGDNVNTGRIYESEELGTVGTHTIRATPYPGVKLQGEQGTPLEISILVVDGSTNAVNEAAPGSRQQLIYLLEDDISFYVSGMLNLEFFGKPGHCLENNLVYADVNLGSVEGEHLMCGTAAPTEAPVSPFGAPGYNWYGFTGGGTCANC
uniref:Uncharacterized protein n=1 Tax=Grammatophora oceanica TaxID=210454 RepID=A0A7S1YLB0_9STRA